MTKRSTTTTCLTPRRTFLAASAWWNSTPRRFRCGGASLLRVRRWSDSQKVWVLEGGWVRDFADGTITRYQRFPVTSLPELSEPPSYFNREVRQASQMSWGALRHYIDGLRKAGFDVANLTVQWHVKLAFPLIAPTIMLLAIPFALLVGTRGAIGGVALGVAIGIVYWTAARLARGHGWRRPASPVSRRLVDRHYFLFSRPLLFL